MEWTTPYRIVLGVGRGLEYLHHGCKTKILYFDIKPQNVLLDDIFSPKVLDFGLAKLCEKKESILSLLDTRGTIGYISPEMISRVMGMDLELGKSRRLMEKGISNEDDDLAKKMTLVGLWCIQPFPPDRPPMNKVVEMME
ncbi:LEAF RUST 10 DISEASE-RESISTANCE LOCUS RECEPTOR-LIKE PROTEIN KINASE-like 2.5 [Arabidopsis lyrata subsp. lyrata]|uniref:LEAF RUST 10 DISEASE-RESISTANCE LOCUS RECEPTOR-LIKE PROTEIN KINASE-like 2.5 n=1 Tax=Arabidopsis lyrata subsp. lyrata TaxID=81972 RepID=UPI000A29DF3F|nr:LEAF RUST 10 DISEASE-RESISTANCE LOCUS RECEPTOR-LIKE PROTEIN KINASE-like 2.5 [Arabidopsis lyrata subsp. lyrata]|eukprot:XP_020865720.1 LEAF RUST 10 DISEASE-RESISTANCE LOCUS RECEPTOR-LIKE PROTEIN KINASE-like 2.5 [Arabidopsis lyrata subsp. lyrata]